MHAAIGKFYTSHTIYHIYLYLDRFLQVLFVVFIAHLLFQCTHCKFKMNTYYVEILSKYAVILNLLWQMVLCFMVKMLLGNCIIFRNVYVVENSFDSLDRESSKLF